MKIGRIFKKMTDASLRGDREAHLEAVRDLASLGDSETEPYLRLVLAGDDPRARAAAREGLLRFTDRPVVRAAVIAGAYERVMESWPRVHNEAAAGAMAAAQMLLEAIDEGAGADQEAVGAPIISLAMVQALGVLESVVGLEDEDGSLLEEAKKNAQEAAVAAAPSEVSLDLIRAIASDESRALGFVEDMVQQTYLTYLERLEQERG